MLTTASIGNTKINIDDYSKDLHGNLNLLCPLGHKLIAKKGKKVTHHFAHYPGSKCDDWRSGMTNWHSQWQKIVLDSKNLEVCLDKDGKILGNSSFNGFNVVSDIDCHIADIINPNYQNPLYPDRPLVIEVQHSPMDKDTIKSREEYYKNMIWLFDLTPRLVKKGNHNKIVFVDGNISYLKEKVGYVALISCQFTCSPINSNNSDEMLSGIFIIINTRTKYWFDTNKPSFFDCGFGMLELIRKLDKGFCLMRYQSYSDFNRKYMPETNQQMLEKLPWFDDISPLDLISIGFMPKIIDVESIILTKSKIIISYVGSELSCVGLTKGFGVWYHDLYDNKDDNSDPLTTLLNHAKNGTGKSVGLHSDAIMVLKLRKYLGISANVEIDKYKYKGSEKIKIICSRETYGMKDKFKSLGMKYSKGKNKKKSFWHGELSNIEKCLVKADI